VTLPEDATRPDLKEDVMRKADPSQKASKRKRTPQRSLAATKRAKEAPRGLVSRRTTARQKNKLRGS
jgi:hypothetical protein